MKIVPTPTLDSEKLTCAPFNPVPGKISENQQNPIHFRNRLTLISLSKFGTWGHTLSETQSFKLINYNSCFTVLIQYPPIQRKTDY